LTSLPRGLSLMSFSGDLFGGRWSKGEVTTRLRIPRSLRTSIIPKGVSSWGWGERQWSMGKLRATVNTFTLLPSNKKRMPLFWADNKRQVYQDLLTHRILYLSHYRIREEDTERLWDGNRLVLFSGWWSPRGTRDATLGRAAEYDGPQLYGNHCCQIALLRYTLKPFFINFKLVINPIFNLVSSRATPNIACPT